MSIGESGVLANLFLCEGVCMVNGSTIDSNLCEVC